MPTTLRVICYYEDVIVNALYLLLTNVGYSSVSSCKSFHADVHAGNLFVLENGKVAFLDFGIVGTVSPKVTHACPSLVLAPAFTTGVFSF
jgi:predicted unusual protein kinase regulating ubiquinone biosynthesis (AarF/ABC1/UbiB family)